MPIRIYALAKDLNVDSKELVTLCTRAGITGKGSALASLSDDEVAKVRAFLEKESASSKQEAEVVPVRRPAAKPQRSIRNIESGKRPKKSRSDSTQDDVAPTQGDTDITSEVEPLEEQIDNESEVNTSTVEKSSLGETIAENPETTVDAEKSGNSSVTGKAPSKVKPTRGSKPLTAASEQKSALGSRIKKGGEKNEEPPAPANTPMRRPTSPLGGRGNIRVLKGASSKKGNGGNGGEAATGKKKEAPAVRLAAMPKVAQPDNKDIKKQSQEKTQKPLMAMTKETSQGVREGKKAPLADLTRNIKKSKNKKKVLEALEDLDLPMAGNSADRKTQGSRKKTQWEGATDLAKMSSSRQQRTRKRKQHEVSDDRSYRRPSRRRSSGKTVNTAAPRKDKVALEVPCTIRTFSEASGVPTAQILKACMGLEIPVMNVNAELGAEAAEMLAMDLGVELELKRPETLEDSLASKYVNIEDRAEDLATRPPIVTFLGHVDHGKTSLLDAIIGLDVVKGEAGGITQHIRAYSVQKGEKSVSFVDTPGHEAFTEMRARGANVTDIAVLVVAADDGIMPQTEEAISHAKAAGVPIIVALNKIDLPGADVNKAMQDLASHDLLPSEWGGETEVVKTSAISGEGIDELLETLLVTAELHEYTANKDRNAAGVCLEAEQESGRGVIAKLIVQNGTLNVGDIVVCGQSYGRVKALYDTLKPKKKLKSATPSIPASVTGLDIPPEAGDSFYVVENIAEARELATQREFAKRSGSLSGRTTKISFENFQDLITTGNLGQKEELVTLNLILRADVRGSIEAIEKELSKISHPEIRINFLQKSVGGITVADVTLADASDAVIIGFNVIPDEAARSLADDRQVEIRRYDIIYKVSEDIRATLEGRLKPDEKVVELGNAIVLRTFSISKVGVIAGCRVMRGQIQRGSRIRVHRGGRTIGDYPLESLRREKDDAKEVSRGMECGIKLVGYNDIKEGDTLESYKIEEVARTL
ncbi:MAG: translation initiation factor IF-2 [Pirellulaceae bacterium]|nr:translation initiation factor IF-2 [Pirellulaceae bacterium]